MDETTPVLIWCYNNKRWKHSTEILIIDKLYIEIAIRFDEDTRDETTRYLHFDIKLRYINSV